MLKVINTALFALTVVGFVGVYAMKYQAEKVGAEIAATETRITRKTEILSAMKANWAFLNQPSTIEPIVIRHAEALGIAPVASQQFGTIDAIPMRPATEPNSEAIAMLLLALEAGLDPTTGETIGGLQ